MIFKGPSNELLQAFFKLSQDAIICVNEQGVIQSLNPFAEQYFGYDQDELVGQPIEILIPEALRGKHVAMREAYMEHPVARPMSQTRNLVARHKAGHLLAVDISLCPIKMNENELIVMAFIRDDSVKRAIENKLNYLAHHDSLTGLINTNALKDKLCLAVDAAKQAQQLLAVCMIDIDDFKEINDTYGHEVGNQLLESFSQRLLKNVRKVDVVARLGGDEFVCLIAHLNNFEYIERIAAKIHRVMNEPFLIHQLILHIGVSIGVSVFPSDTQDEKNLLIQADLAMYRVKRSGKNGYLFYNAQAITEKQKSIIEEREKGKTQGYDELTAIPNFIHFRQYIQHTLTIYPLKSQTIVLCGIDNFRLINDTRGTVVADRVLSMIPKRLQSVLQKHELLARKAGDEFILVLHTSSMPVICKKIEAILKLFSEPFLVNEYEIYLTVSIGVSRYPIDARHLEELLMHADVAMHQVKKIGKNYYQFFSLRGESRVRYLQKLQQDLPHALERGELFLSYQPQIDLMTRQVVGAEALLRWKNPTVGLVSPQIFIPLMESSGLIISVGEWVLKQACLQVKVWHKLKPTLKMAVNISAYQFTSHRYKKQFLLSVKQALQQAELSPEFLELEITESMILRDDLTTKNNIKRLKNLGVGLSCDDFGIGYTSFNRLKQLPLNTIKIDKSLIDDITKKSIDIIIVKSILAIGQQLGIRVVAEGVERMDQLDLLADLGCPVVQGFYFSKPVLPRRFARLL